MLVILDFKIKNVKYMPQMLKNFKFVAYCLADIRNYMLFESVVTNIVYYGCAFILFITNMWIPTLIGIALLFGIGNAFDSVVSFVAYRYLLKKEKINILDVE